MNTLTSREVQSEVYRLLKDSPLKKALNGGLYHDTTRPRDSKGEDILIRYTAGTAGDIAEGVVTILIYSQPIVARDGTLREDLARTSEIERLAQQWVSSLRASHYLFTLRDTIQTYRDTELQQDFTSVKLTYRNY